MSRKPTSGRSQDGKWNLITGEDSYAGQNAQNPSTARKVQSWIPTDNGELHRELVEPKYLPTTLSGPVVGLYQFKQANADGTDTQFFFAAARTNNTPGTKTCNLYQQVSGAWSLVSAVGTLADAPQCVTQQNDFYLADGASNFIFNGTSWAPIGMQIPSNIPSVNIVNGSPIILFGSNPAGDANPVTAFLLKPGDSSHHGDFNSNFGDFTVNAGPPITVSGASKATGTSILFNPPQLTGTPDPNTGTDIKWATLNGSGVITGYTTPFPGQSFENYSLSVVFAIKIPKAGNYTIGFQHDDGAFFGISNGVNTGATPTKVAGSTGPQNIWQTSTAIMGYQIPQRGGGTNKSGNWNDAIVVNFPVADTYNIEINYRQWEHESQLVFLVNGAPPIPGAGSNPGSVSANIGKYYWFTNADQTTGRATESSSSPDFSAVTGSVTGAKIRVYQQPGLFTSSNASPTVTGASSTDSPGPTAPDLTGRMVGQVLYINGTLIGTIAGVGGGHSFSLASVQTNDGLGHTKYLGTITGGAGNAFVGQVFVIAGFTNSNNNGTFVCTASDNGSLTLTNPNGVAETHAATATSPGNTLLLTANAAATVSSGRAVIADARATHWNVYASETDGSKVGQFLASVPVTQNLSSTPFEDSSPFIDDPTNQYLPIYRPVRNDPPPQSRLLEVYKARQFRRRESEPFFFNFTANEEVTSGNNGDPTQCVPGADVNTISDMVNEDPYPDQSARIRALTSHMDALYMFSEKQCYPLYGESVDDFAVAQHVAFSLGGAGRFATKSTPYGLAFISYDRRGMLYPSSVYGTRIVEIMDTTSQLAEIGKPMRNKFALMDPARLDEVVTEFYLFGIRAWWIVSFPQKDGTYAAYVYDFTTQRWFQLQRGFSSLKTFEITAGNFVLVGGASDGNTYVIDDQTGTFNMTGTYPQSTFITSLIDFGDPEHAHVFRALELEFDNPALAQDITVTYWLDPVNVDNPGVGKVISLRPAHGAGRWRTFSEGGATCQRLLIQIQARSSANAGVIRGIKLVADTVPGMLPSNQAGGN